MEPNVTVKNVFKDRKGKFLLPLGNLEGKMIKRVFSLRNNGSAPSFAHVSFVSYEPCLFSNVRVTPPAVVLLADEEKEVTITFTLKKKRLNQLKKYFSAPVINSGKLKLLCGNEMDSGRLRQLYKNASEKALPTNPDVEKILEVLPVEAMPFDLKLMEPISALDDIMRLFTTQEIVVTLNLKLTKQLVL